MIKPPPSDQVFAILSAARRVWAVGAVHADAVALGALHEAVWPRFRRGDRLVYLGNLLGIGTDGLGTLDEVLRFRRRILTLPGMEAHDVVFLRGAQEEMWNKLLQIQFATTPAEVFDWMLAQGVGATLAAYGGQEQAARSVFREGPLAITRWTGQLRAAMHAHPGHDELFSALRRASRTAGGELLFVHAGIDPSRPLTEQGDTFWWGSGHFAELDKAPYAGFRRVIRGYDRRHRGIALPSFSATVDGGCGYGGRLTAGCFDLAGEALDWVRA